MATKTKKTRKQLKQKIRKLRQRLSELEEDKAERGQLEETIKQRETMLAVLNSIATVMMEASLDLDDVLQEIADGMVKAFGCNTALILLLDEREGVFKGSAVSTKGKLIEKINSIVGFPLAQIDFSAQADFNQAVANALDGRMTVRGDLYELVGPALNKSVCSTLQRLTGSKMFFSIPLLAKGKVVGGIFASTGEKLSEEDKETMMTFGNLAAYAIENVRLFGKGERRSTQLELISKVSEKATSILDLDILLQEVSGLIQENFNYYNVSLFLLDRERNELVMEGVAGGFEHIAPGDYCQPLEEGIMGFVARTGNSWMANDINKDPYYIKGFLGEVLTKSELCVPINLDEKIIGILDVQSIHVNDFGRMDLIALEAVAKQVAIAIENARLFQRTNRWAEEMVALREVDMAILSSLEQDEVFEITLDQLGKVIDYDTAAIKIFTPDGLDKMIAGRGPITGDQLMWEGFELKNSKINREMMETKKPVVIHNTHTDERFEPVGDWEEFHSWVGAPLLVRDELIGYLAVEKKTPNFYDEKAAQLLADFAHAAAIALENARLYEDLQQELAERKKAEEKLEKSLERLKGSFDATVKALAETANHRDPYTTSHQQRVTQLACAIAWEMNLSEERIEGIRIAGQIHDIGKMSVPAEILSKPSELNDLEMDLIKTHVQVGYDILEGIEFPWPVADMVLQHHERMDGSGYPNGISGEDIMLEARILAVADVVEAMASYRPYRPAKGIDKALKEISQNKGKLYDPEVVDTCIKLFGEKGFEFEEDESDD